MGRKLLAALVVLSILCLVMVQPQPAAAQLVPPNRNAFSFSIATFSPSLFNLGIAYPIAPAWDVTFSYSVQSAAGATGSLITLGGRYHFRIASGLSPYVGAGLASSGTSISGFGASNASGLFLTAGASLAISERFGGYASVTLFSLGGGSSSVIDLGVQARLADRVAGQLGFISFSGSAAPYIGITVGLR